MTLRKGITHAYVARLYKGGMTFEELATLYDCYIEDIEQIVREVMVREENGK